jgi:CubicO group peptidase (beta-lactamase class C family)
MAGSDAYMDEKAEASRRKDEPMAKSGCARLWGLLTVSLVLTCNPASQDAARADSGANDRKYIAQGKYTGSYWPTRGWRTCNPEAVRMDSRKLSEAVRYAATPEYNTEGLVVIKDGYIVAEAYFGKFRQDSTHVSHSMAKSFTSALIGIAIDQKLLSGIHEKLCRYYQDWDANDKDDPRSRITIRHALTLTSGLKWQEDWSKWDPATNDALKMGASGRFVKYMSGRAGLHEPGQRFTYSTGDPMLLSLVLQKATGMTAFGFARKNLFKPLNISKVRWDGDREGYTSTAWGLHTTVRNYAKFGYLYLNKGRWENRQIVPKQWVAKSTRTDPGVKMWNAYGYLWHVNLPVRLNAPGSNLPADGYMAEGVLGQNIVVIPSQKLVIVKVANQRRAQLDLVKFLGMILDSAGAKAPGGWEPLAPMLGERFEHGVAALGGTLYVFGGYARGVKTSRHVQAFDVAGNRWRRLKDMPSTITHVNTAVDGRSVWIAGGFKDGYPGKAVDEVWRYDVDKDTFVAAPPLPAPRAGGGLALVGRRLHYFGGLKADRDTDSSDHWVLDLSAAGGPTKWTTAAAMPAPRNQFGTVVHKGKIWAIGGQFRHDSRNGKPALDQTRVDLYDPKADSWSPGPALPIPHSHSENSTFVHEGRIIVLGGRSVNRVLADIWAFSRDGKWSRIGKLPVPLIGPAARVVVGRLVVAGGAPGGFDPLSAVWARTLSQ